MKFKFVRAVAGKVPGYQGRKVATGDVVDLSAHFAAKAEQNPDYERVDETASQPQARSKKKVSRRGQNQG